MITFLQGEVVEKHATRVVMLVGGVGYEVAIPLSSYHGLPASGETCRLLTYDYVREDSHQLFGFMSEEERRVFTMLLGISGVGPKLALSALSGLTVGDLRAAVLEGDVKRLSSISGVGKKTAERMVVELRDRFGAEDDLTGALEAWPFATEQSSLRDAMMALVALGYPQEAARKMVQSAMKGEPDLPVEAIIKKALGG